MTESRVQTNVGKGREPLSALPLIIVVLIFAVAVFENVRVKAFADEVIPTSVRSAREVLSGDYSKFDHANPKEHKDLMGKDKCGSCHRRSDESTEPKFPVHKDCTGCHMVQFTAPGNTSSINPICTICHKPEGLNSPAAPLKAFSRLVSFSADFDHAQHLQGISEARPAGGCLTCHSPINRGIAESVPTRLAAHRVCYECHSPGKQASKTFSCGSCHSFGRQSSISLAARSYRVGFSHSDHATRARLTCERCHVIRGRGLPETRQVSSIVPVQHSPNPSGCIYCHDGRHSFGEQVKGNFDNCRRCHKGSKFGS